MDINKLLTIGKLKKCKPDDIVFYERDEGQEMYLILQGLMGVYSHNVDGSRILLAELKAGDFFGEMSLVDNQPRSADVQALDDATLFVIDQQNFEKVVATFPDLAIKIMKGMSLRIRGLNESYKQILKTAKEMELHIDSEEESKSIMEEAIDTKEDKSNRERAEDPDNNEQERLIAEKYQKLRDSSGYQATKNYIENTKDKGESAKITYEQIYAEDTSSNNLITSMVKCPVCEQSFETERIRNTLLKQKGENRDFRLLYHDFEPYWYKIWVCPHCYYGNFDHEFQKVHYLKKKEILEKTNKMRLKYPIKWGQRKSLERVIAELLLCQDIHSMLPKERLPFAKIWLYLSWLYEDSKDYEMFEFANQQAVDAYVDFYNNDMMDLAEGQEIRLCMLIAELYKKQENYDETVKYLYKAVRMRTEPQRLRELASERLMEYKDLVSKK